MTLPPGDERIAKLLDGLVPGVKIILTEEEPVLRPDRIVAGAVLIAAGLAFVLPGQPLPKLLAPLVKSGHELWARRSWFGIQP